MGYSGIVWQKRSARRARQSFGTAAAVNEDEALAAFGAAVCDFGAEHCGFVGGFGELGKPPAKGDCAPVI